MTTVEYTFRNQREQMDGLQRHLDPVTRSELAHIGVSHGWRCLDVGAGGGSVALMLAGLVGPTGHVTALDVDTGLLTAGANLDIHRHDIRTDAPLPGGGSFDLIHARLVTQHLPERRQVLHRLTGALAPGGWLLLGEFVTAPRLIAAPTEANANLVTRISGALIAVLADAGVDMDWGNQIHTVLRDHGLTDVHTRWHAHTWAGGGYGARLLANNVTQKRPQLLAAGVTPAELDAFATLMNIPHLVMRSYEFASTRARRPARI